MKQPVMQISVYQSDDDENSRLTGCYALPVGKQLPTLRRSFQLQGILAQQGPESSFYEATGK